MPVFMSWLRGVLSVSGIAALGGAAFIGGIDRSSAEIVPAAEMRGLWVVRTGLTSPESVDRIVDRAYRAGLNALFVQVRGRGDAFYSSKIVPRSELLRKAPDSFDPLERVLSQARARGMQVHAWFNLLLTANYSPAPPQGHILARHPGWAMVPRWAAEQALLTPPGRDVLSVSRGDYEGHYLSPSAEGVGEHLEQVVRELVRAYDVDGLHFDYVRYPGPEYDYSRAALSGFRRWLGQAEDRALLALPQKNPQVWDEYRRQMVTSLVQRLGSAARSERPGVVLSAAVIPDEKRALDSTYQNWPRWGEEGSLSAVCPMAYTPDGELFREQVARARARVGDRCAVWAGVGAYRLTLSGIVRQIRTAREAGSSGVILFSHESLPEGYTERLRQQAFETGATPSAGAASAGGSFR